MSLIAPAWLLVCALAVVVAILHVRRHRVFVVPSIALWRLIDSGSLPRHRMRPPARSCD